MTEHCADCRFAKDGYHHRYQCHRFPPTVRTNGSGTGPITDWPTVGGQQWCGEFQLSPKIAAYEQRQQEDDARRKREADELVKAGGPTAEITNLARIAIERGWDWVIEADSHTPEDNRFHNRDMVGFLGRNDLFQAIVHAKLPLGAIHITPRGLQVRRAVEALKRARA